ncbi:hypothetical protein DJ018_16195 [Phenylobacterium deserti]|uniref:Uncharacterized protein n=1 Tax=Phenylobacterium deserti TaxID=1914756 RepID=A0A328ADI7_9CAUL|nr:hypothetical protein DJ018_16195 [Phenylobacterium deserti]
MLPLNGADRLEAFVATCLLINGMCRGTLWDMSGRCPAGKSYLEFGAVAFMRQLEKSALSAS